MPITEWYLNITQLPVFDQPTLDYLDSLKPHKARHWDLKTNQMKAYKISLLEQLLKIQDGRCVYCGTGLRGHLIDREHFVHKDQKGGWPEFMFITENLFAACGYCNRRVKGTAPMISLYRENYAQCQFRLIHPYFDTPANDLTFVKINGGASILAQSLTQKGLDTMAFFELASPAATARRAAYITEVETFAELSANDFADLKSISHFKPT